MQDFFMNEGENLVIMNAVIAGELIQYYMDADFFVKMSNGLVLVDRVKAAGK